MASISFCSCSLHFLAASSFLSAAAIKLSKSFREYLSPSEAPSPSFFPSSVPACLTSSSLFFAPEMIAVAIDSPASKLLLNATPFFISLANAFAALPIPLMPSSLKTLIASTMPLKGAITNFRMAFPTPTRPSTILENRPFDVIN